MAFEHKFRPGGGGGPGLQRVLSLCPHCGGRQTGGGGGVGKLDPLVAALEGVTFDHYPPNDAKTIRAALDAAGFEIREKGQ